MAVYEPSGRPPRTPTAIFLPAPPGWTDAAVVHAPRPRVEHAHGAEAGLDGLVEGEHDLPRGLRPAWPRAQARTTRKRRVRVGRGARRARARRARAGAPSPRLHLGPRRSAASAAAPAHDDDGDRGQRDERAQAGVRADRRRGPRPAAARTASRAPRPRSGRPAAGSTSRRSSSGPLAPSACLGGTLLIQWMRWSCHSKRPAAIDELPRRARPSRLPTRARRRPRSDRR